MKNKKLFIASASLIIAVIAFLVYWFVFRTTKTKQNNNSNNPPKKAKQQIVWTDDSFPLHLYSSGANVKALQQALLDNINPNSLPKHGADGKFGNETLTALTSNGFPATIDQATLTQIQNT